MFATDTKGIKCRKSLIDFEHVFLNEPTNEIGEDTAFVYETKYRLSYYLRFYFHQVLVYY